MDETALAGLLAEAPDDLGRRVARPGWVDLVERAVRRELTDVADVPDDWQDAFALPLSPLVAEASSPVRTAAGRLEPEVDVDVALLRELHEQLLAPRLRVDQRAAVEQRGRVGEPALRRGGADHLAGEPVPELTGQPVQGVALGHYSCP